MTAQIFATPELNPSEIAAIGLIDELREEMRASVAEPRRWAGTLRRMEFARAVQGSNSIEGYNASLDDAIAAVEDEPTLDAEDETVLAIAGYRDAMTYVLQLAEDADAVVDQGLLKSLHFMMLRHRLDKSPGRWRPGDIHVERDETGEVVYTGPDADLVPKLIDGMLTALHADDSSPLVRGAMVHLNLVMIHPFRDGNGRMARCLQTLVLARDRIVAPIFSSIEEFLGRNTEAYYDILADVGAGAWHPQRDARPWVRFCLRAHYLQALTVQRRREEIELLWERSLGLAEDGGLPERAAAALMDAAYGRRIRRSGYQSLTQSVVGEEVSDLTASRDLAAMTEAGLLDARGQTRGRFYVASDRLATVRDEVRKARPPRASGDVFEVAENRRQATLAL